MAMRNVVMTPVICPVCGVPYRYGFELDVGKFVRADLDISSDLPWEGIPPVGIWFAVGVGYCNNCKHFIEVRCLFDGLRLTTVEPIKNL